VLEYIERYNAADSDGMWELMAPDFVRCSTSSNWKPTGPDMYRDMSQRWNASFDDTRWELIDLAVSGNTVVCEFLETATMSRPYPINDEHTIQPNGQSYRGRATVWFTVNGAGLINTYRYYSAGGFEQAYHAAIATSGTGALYTAVKPSRQNGSALHPIPAIIAATARIPASFG
jgi:predicted ester cyclase